MLDRTQTFTISRAALAGLTALLMALSLYGCPESDDGVCPGADGDHSCGPCCPELNGTTCSPYGSDSPYACNWCECNGSQWQCTASTCGDGDASSDSEVGEEACVSLEEVEANGGVSWGTACCSEDDGAYYSKPDGCNWCECSQGQWQCTASICEDGDAGPSAD